MASSTLTSLAMLKVHLDQGQDYLDYLRPFILQVLIDHKPNPVTDSIVREYIQADYGLLIPDRAVQIVLKRLSRDIPLKKDRGVYTICGDIQDPEIAVQKAKADRHIKAVINGLIEFSKTTVKPFASEAEASNAICVFLSKFNIQCLRAFLRGTAIPIDEKVHDSNIVVISKYVLNLQDTDPERFESFLIMATGLMLANALLCPDLTTAPKTYNGVCFFFDTPLLVRLLGFEGEPRQNAVKSLITLLLNLGGEVAAFSHSREELEKVVTGAASYIDLPEGRGPIISEARERGQTKSDILLMLGKVDENLKLSGVTIIPTPRYTESTQIDESAFESVLTDEVTYYYNPRAKEYDINSVRSIYVLRAHTNPLTVEKSKAIFVTSNAAFARAAFQYGNKHEASREVSSVITDFSLANMAWLKAPMGDPSLPMTEMIAFSYAALRPSHQLLDKYLCEIDKLQKMGEITERDHQLLRSAQTELMNLTLGEEEALTKQTVTEMLKRVTKEIKGEESEKLEKEQASHMRTQKQLASVREQRRIVQGKLYWRCHRNAKVLSWVIAIVISVLVVVGLLATGFGLKPTSPIVGWILIGCSILVVVLGAIDLFVGFSLKEFRITLEKKLEEYLLKRESALLGLDLQNSE